VEPADDTPLQAQVEQINQNEERKNGLYLSIPYQTLFIAVPMFKLWQKLNVWNVPTFKMHHIGNVPTFKMHHMGTVPKFKMQHLGTVPTFKMHHIGTDPTF
jgi:hypothetical protein